MIILSEPILNPLRHSPIIKMAFYLELSLSKDETVRKDLFSPFEKSFIVQQIIMYNSLL